MDWSGKKKEKKSENCPEIKLLDSTKNKQPYTNIKASPIFLICP